MASSIFFSIAAYRRLQGQITPLSATSLLEAGVGLKKKVFAEDYERALQLKVSSINGTLAMPQLLLNRSAEVGLRNLVATSRLTIPAMLS